MEPDERIFVYLRVRSGDEVLAKSKVRELRALGGLLADFIADGTIGAAPAPRDASAGIAIEYVDASDDHALVRFQADHPAGQLVVTGQIPDRYRRRMLGRGADGATLSREEFERRVGGKLGDSTARELADDVFGSTVDLVALIEKAIDPQGRFVVRVPMT